MAGDLAWAALAATAVLAELAARRRRRRLTTIGGLTALVACRLPGRLLLFGLWCWVGLHLFARGTAHA